MPAFLDDQPLDAPDGDLAALLELAQDRLPDDRILVEIQVDGQSLSDDALDARMAQPMGSSEVRLLSARPGDVAAEALAAVRDNLGEARVLQAEAADLLQRDQSGEGLQKVSIAIGAWINIAEPVQQAASLLGIDLDTFAVEDEALIDAISDLTRYLEELRELLQAGDTIAIADAMAYEWLPLTDRWDTLIGGMLDRAAP